MKKIILLGLTAIISLNAVAQYKNNSLVELPTQPILKVKNEVDYNQLNSLRTNKKKTRANKVNYNIGSYVAAFQGIANADWYSFLQSSGGTNPNGRMAYNYLWPDSTMRYGSTSTSGMTFSSIGQVLDPTAGIFTSQIQNPDVVIGPLNSYKVDSIYLFCAYDRMQAASVNDTLILSFVIEDAQNLPVSGWTSGNVTTNFNADTVTFLSQYFDSLAPNPNFQTNMPGGGAPVIIKKILDVAAANDTIGGGWHLYGFAPNLNVPAGRAVSVSISYKPGSTWVPFVDSIANFNQFLFVSHEENIGGFFNYTKWDFNSSNVVTKTSDIIPNVQGWGGNYLPALAYTAPYAYEFHDIDWVLTCTTCTPAATNDITPISNVVVSPNPASDLVNFSFNIPVSYSNVEVTISNTLGQIVKSSKVGKINANIETKSTVSVADLAPGLYIYTINADGEKTSGKLMVK